MSAVPDTSPFEPIASDDPFLESLPEAHPSLDVPPLVVTRLKLMRSDIGRIHETIGSILEEIQGP